MADEDFDFANLAAYLHLEASQVERLVERGKIPGRKVGGRWRFSRAEIHHWLEERIGVSDDDELVQMESVLRRFDDSTSGNDVVISELLSTDAIGVPLSARTRASVISKMTQLAADTGLLWDPEKMAEAVKAREAMQPTALDIGVALLHPRRPMPSILGEPLLALGVTQSGIPFGGSRGMLTDVFFLICSMDDQNHLRILARLSRLISVPEFLSDLRGAESPGAAYEIIAEHEGTLD